MEKRTVHEVESLGGSGGGGAFHERFLGSGEVEGPHDGWEEASTDFSVDGTASFVRSLVNLNGGSSRFGDEAAADLQGGVAPGFEILSLAVGPSVVVIGGVALMGAEAGALPGLRGDDVANEGFGGPLIILKE